LLSPRAAALDPSVQNLTGISLRLRRGNPLVAFGGNRLSGSIPLLTLLPRFGLRARSLRVAWTLSSIVFRCLTESSPGRRCTADARLCVGHRPRQQSPILPSRFNASLRREPERSGPYMHQFSRGEKPATTMCLRWQRRYYGYRHGRILKMTPTTLRSCRSRLARFRAIRSV
jgi:hypothetical protein